MKKIIAFIIIIFMVFMVTACNPDPVEEPASNTAETVTEPVDSETVVPASTESGVDYSTDEAVNTQTEGVVSDTVITTEDTTADLDAVTSDEIDERGF